MDAQSGQELARIAMSIGVGAILVVFFLAGVHIYRYFKGR